MLSSIGQQQHRDQNAEQHWTSRDELSSKQLGQIQIQDTSHHKAVWDALIQEQWEYRLHSKGGGGGDIQGMLPEIRNVLSTIIGNICFTT